ncbi:MAG: hypothetical protein K2X97_01285, partial [Mycobacteriaceae bacterium]|nr:hypothetical protein [Mycobacteriaceae bacterium]
QNLGFTFTYDKRLYDRLCNSPAKEVIAHLSAGKDYQSRMARFIENHDERRCTQVFGAHTLTAFATLIATLPGLSFFHQGQFEGRTIHLPMPLNQAAKEKPDTELIRLYTTLLNVAKDPVFHDGDWQLLEAQHNNDQTHEHLIAYRWKSSTAYRLVIVNLNHGISHGRLFIADDLPESAEHKLTDLLNGEHYQRQHEDIKNNGLYIRLESYKAHIFEVI